MERDSGIDSISSSDPDPGSARAEQDAGPSDKTYKGPTRDDIAMGENGDADLHTDTGRPGTGGEQRAASGE